METGEIYAKITQMRSTASILGRSSATIMDSIDALDREVRALSADRFMSVGAETFRVEYNRATPKLRDAFERCATQVTNASDGSVEVQVRSFDIVDQSTWETLRSGGRAGKTWFFWANFRRGDERIQYCFFFGRHFFSPIDQGVANIGPSACLLVSEQIGEGEAVLLENIDNCAVTLREVITVDDKLARKHFDLSLDSLAYDLNVDPLVVAREFVQEVLLNRMA